jgi:23S rRNA pseudoU1915 N3-methylase RlmH
VGDQNQQVCDRTDRTRSLILPCTLRSIYLSTNATDPYYNQILLRRNRYCTFQSVNIKPNPKGSPDPEQQKVGESERVLKQISPRDYVVLLDERGREVTSEQLTDVLEEAGNRKASAVVFCIGEREGLFQCHRCRRRFSHRVLPSCFSHSLFALPVCFVLFFFRRRPVRPRPRDVRAEG